MHTSSMTAILLSAYFSKKGQIQSNPYPAVAGLYLMTTLSEGFVNVTVPT